MTTSTDRPAGWYPDPTNPRINHYWTGTTWGEPPTPTPPAPPTPAAPTSVHASQEDHRGLLIFGYTLGVLIPILGWVTAITIGAQARYRAIRSHAIGIALASITAAVIYLVIILSASHPACTYGQHVANNVARSLSEALPYPACR